MYDIYIGKPEKEIYNWLYSFTEEEYNELFSFIDKINYKIKALTEIKNYKETVNFSFEIIQIKNELEYINKINGNIKFALALEEACNKALENNLELICSGED